MAVSVAWCGVVQCHDVFRGSASAVGEYVNENITLCPAMDCGRMVPSSVYLGESAPEKG